MICMDLSQFFLCLWVTFGTKTPEVNVELYWGLSDIESGRVGNLLLIQCLEMVKPIRKQNVCSLKILTEKAGNKDGMDPLILQSWSFNKSLVSLKVEPLWNFPPNIYMTVHSKSNILEVQPPPQKKTENKICQTKPKSLVK